MAETTLPAGAPLEPAALALLRARVATRLLDVGIRSLVPVVLALVAGGLLLAALGRNPFTFYGHVWDYGVAQDNWQQSAVSMVPLLLIAVGLTVIFRANIWNLGYNGQFALGAALVAGYGPTLVDRLPLWFAFVLLALLAAAVGAAWTLVPALLKAWYGTNEIITTLMMSFVGVDLADYLIKGPFQDPSIRTPQTRAIAFDKLLPPIPGTSIDVSLLVAFAAVLVVHYVLTRTAFGLRLHVLGANPRAARHMGIDLPRLTVSSFLISGALIGGAAAAYVLSPFWGYVRADQIPTYGDSIIPFVFLARLNALAVVPFVAFYAILSTGGDFAASQENLPTDFLLVLVGLILLFMTVIEYLGRRRELGSSYLPAGLVQALRATRRPAPKPALDERAVAASGVDADEGRA
ncbi:MAG TPA: ABC transporter permease [Gaiellaceae bacterium]|nr:ABC transporter permease [Gaiellaceae bacterium]